MIGKTFFLLFVALWASLSAAAVVYRADRRDPSAIKSAGGFLSKGTSKAGAVAPDISLWNHVTGDASGFSRDNDGYVSTTTDLALANSWVVNNLGGNGYVYTIQVAPNMVDCAEILGKYNRYPQEKEYAALGGIPYDQIISWTQFTNKKAGKATKNSDYNSRRYKRLVHATGQFQLAAFPANHPAWKESPWSAFATCTNPKIRAARALVGRATCKPKKTNLQYAQEYAAKMYS